MSLTMQKSARGGVILCKRKTLEINSTFLMKDNVCTNSVHSTHTMPYYRNDQID